MLGLIQELVEDALAADTPAAAASTFGRRLDRLGPSYYQIRRYLRPRGVLTSERHWEAGGVLARDARAGWVGSEGFKFICFGCNPLLAVVQQHRTRYRFSDFAPRGERRFGPYWEAFSGGAIVEGWGANAYGPDGRVASVHVGIDRVDIEPTVGRALQMAGGIVAEHLLTLDAPYPEAPAASRLTRRERDVMRFVAQGKTDWEVSVILGVSESTARFHVDNARRKLGAMNRPHAVARFIAEEGLD